MTITVIINRPSTRIITINRGLKGNDFTPSTTDSISEGIANLYFTYVRASAAAPVQSVAGKTGAVTLEKGDVGLDNVDNTRDADKPVSTAQSTALSLKQDKATATTGTAITFALSKIFGSATSPESGNITNDLAGAKLGVVQKIYHNNGTAPSIPAGWVKLGSGSYVTSALNVIYCEWVGGTRVEYWVTQ